MEASVREALSGVATVQDVIKAFKDEDHCRRLLEAMVWPTGRICLACNYRSSIVLMGRELGSGLARTLPMLKRHLPISVHRHNTFHARGARFGCGCQACG